MMSEFRELYQEVILDHSKSPRNAVFPANANRSGDGYNPLCGDKITVKLWVEDGTVRDIGFEACGCAISTAAASTMSEAIKGKSIADIKALFAEYHALVTGKTNTDHADLDALDKLIAFGGVAEFPMRVKCATLAWHTMCAALDQADSTVKTE